jgi:hypothetical protein
MSQEKQFWVSTEVNTFLRNQLISERFLRCLRITTTFPMFSFREAPPREVPTSRGGAAYHFPEIRTLLPLLPPQLRVAGRPW